MPWPEAAASLRRAEAAFRLAAQGRLCRRAGARARAATAAQGSPPAARPTGAAGRPGRPGPPRAASLRPPRAGQSRARLVVADEHLPALLLAAAPGIAADLARTRLAPLDGLGEGPRERLVATLRAWLDRPGQVQAIAAALDVHPQTVRYRLKQLRELFGDRLEDPDARFELSLALRAADGVRY